MKNQSRLIIDKMGNTASQIPQSMPKDYFIIDRIIAPSVTIGVSKALNTENRLSSQGIRYIEKGPIHRLEEFKEFQNCLEYKFEKDVSLSLCKVNEEVMMTLKTPEQGVSIQKIDPIFRRVYKPISMVSEELDKIGSMMK